MKKNELKNKIIDFKNRVYGTNIKYEEFDDLFPNEKNIFISSIYPEDGIYGIETYIDIKSLTINRYIEDKLLNVEKYLENSNSEKEIISSIEKLTHEFEYADYEYFTQYSEEELNLVGFSKDKEGNILKI